MIRQFLDMALKTCETYGKYRITEFQIGSETMKLLIKEYLEMTGFSFKADIKAITKYRDIPISSHPSKFGISYIIINNIKPRS